MKNLIPRIVTGVVLVPLVIGFIYLGGMPLWILLSLILLGAAWEFNNLMKTKGLLFPSVFHLILMGGFILGLWGVGHNLLFAVILEILFLMLILLYMPMARQHFGMPSESISELMAGFFFLSFGGLSLWFIRLYGFWNLIFYLLLIWLFDTGGLVGGSLHGKHKLAPDVSPKKSWEGLIMGYIWAILWVFIAKAIPGLKNAVSGSTLGMVGAVLVISTVAQLGDLIESVWKREAGVKDSSNLFPGHGGVLDRIDSVFTGAPFYLLWLIFTRGLLR